jgi:UDP-glucose 4-epimerase
VCASIVVSESVSDPLKYFDNNVSGTVTLLQTMKEFGVKFFVFSSTAAVFGMPDRIPIHEDDKKFCLNPYGDSKYFVEQILERCDIAYGMKYTILRYFNACGAHPDGTVGECHDPETHLIPLVLQVPLGKRPHIKVFGTDYPTEDGTCIRDYVHVSDLSTVHILALEQMIKTGKSDVFNLGNGKGYSVLEIIDIARKVTGHAIPVVNEARRDGDAAVLVASSEKTEKVLGWKPKFGLKEIIESAWNFHKSHKDGFKTK